jgi:Predicted membrane protein
MRGISSFRFDVWERYGKNTGTKRMSQRYRSFREFYPFYLSEHANPACRRLHFVGTTLVIVFLVTAILTRNGLWLAGALVAGYGFAWIGHFFFEHNRPATFTYPIYSFIGDWVMFKDLLTGKIRF